METVIPRVLVETDGPIVTPPKVTVIAVGGMAVPPTARIMAEVPNAEPLDIVCDAVMEGIIPDAKKPLG